MTLHRLLAEQHRKATRPDGTLDVDALLALVSSAYGDSAQGADAEAAGPAARREELLGHLQKQNLRFEAAIENMSQGLAMFDGDRRLTVCNRLYAELHGLYGGDAGVNPGLADIFSLSRAAGVFPAAYYLEVEELIAERKPWFRIWELSDGRIVAVSSRPMPDGGWVETQQDITEQRRAQARIDHMARHDALTGLPNRLLFYQRLNEQLALVRRGEEFAVLALDLDRFKGVNDTLGHPVGDQLLVAVAARLKGCIRGADVAARLGGDEFVIMQRGARQPMGATALAERLIEAISRPYDIEGHRIVLGTSVGVAVAPHDGTDADQLIRSADLALYRAKGVGRGGYRFYEPLMDAEMKARRALETDLRRSLEDGDFELYYQPKIRPATNRVTGFEALLRWRHPVRGIVKPGDFIPLCEEIGLIIPLGEWVLRQACAEAATWPDDIDVAVNLSPVQFRSRNLVAVLSAALAASGLDPRRLTLEITETALLDDSDATLAALHQFRSFGVRISMDDFGTGYSSLGHLRRFPFDQIKIDRSFVRDFPDEPDSLAIVRAVAGLGASLGMATIAEGVETARQAELLQEEGCTEVQGFYYSPPIPADEIGPLLESFRGRTAKVA